MTIYIRLFTHRETIQIDIPIVLRSGLLRYARKDILFKEVPNILGMNLVRHPEDDVLLFRCLHH